MYKESGVLAVLFIIMSSIEVAFYFYLIIEVGKRFRVVILIVHCFQSYFDNHLLCVVVIIVMDSAGDQC